MRFIPALAGSLVPSFSYMLCREIGISPVFSVLAGLLTIFGEYNMLSVRDYV
jgi:dolichyl-phosphate-mannose--protein O-mannosyl transferase